MLGAHGGGSRGLQVLGAHGGGSRGLQVLGVPMAEGAGAFRPLDRAAHCAAFRPGPYRPVAGCPILAAYLSVPQGRETTNPTFTSLVSGLDFSHAEKAAKMARALAPEGRYQRIFTRKKPCTHTLPLGLTSKCNCPG